MQLMKEHQSRLERFKNWLEAKDHDLLLAGSILIAAGLFINYLLEFVL
ncbi:hypothetical protein THIOSC15_3050005 [uncultured Thiomicrorhabdus sp.]